MSTETPTPQDALPQEVVSSGAKWSGTNQTIENSANTSPRQSREPGKSGLVHNLLIPLALLGVGAGVVWALGSVEPDQRAGDDTSLAGRMKALAAVRVEPIRSLQESGATLQLAVDGTVVPFREARVAAEVAGKVIYKAPECEAGTFVKKGQLLMRLDATDYELQVQRLQRQREQEYEALGEIDQEMVNTNRLISVAKEDLQLQQNEVDRQNSLPDGFSSRGEVDRAKRTLLQARQQLVASENQLDLLRKRRSRLEASERLAATQLKVAEIDLQRTEIVAPINGVIVNEDADLNTFVSRGSALITIDDTTKVEVATSLRMDQLDWVLDQESESVDEQSQGYRLPETPATIEFAGASRNGVMRHWKGRLLGYDGIGLDATTRTVPVRVVVDDPQTVFDAEGLEKGVSGATALVRGMFVRVNLLIKPKTPLVVIPGRALKPGNQVWEFAIDDSVLEPKQKQTQEATQDDDSARNAPEASNESDSSSPRAPQPDSEFDVDQWVAGKVIVRQSIVPVDSLSVSGHPDANEDASETDTDARMWVCEARDQSLVHGSFVVTSPLGSLESGEIPARTRNSLVNADAAMLENK